MIPLPVAFPYTSWRLGSCRTRSSGRSRSRCTWIRSRTRIRGRSLSRRTLTIGSSPCCAYWRSVRRVRTITSPSCWTTVPTSRTQHYPGSPVRDELTDTSTRWRRRCRRCWWETRSERIHAFIIAHHRWIRTTRIARFRISTLEGY
jgi:hypothetical protein